MTDTPADATPAEDGLDPAALDPSTIRIRPLPEGQEAQPITVWNMLNAMGQVMVLPEEAGAPKLEYPQGDRGSWERALALGNVQQVRDELKALLTDENLALETDIPDDVAAARGLRARAHIMDGDLAAATVDLKGLRNDDRMCMTEACLCVGEGAIGRAREKINVALQENPKGAPEHYIHALVCVAEGDYQRGMEELNRVADSSPEHAVARHQLAQLVLATGDPARAGTLFEMAIQLSPTFLPPAVSLAELLADSHQYGDAVRILANAAEAVPEALAPRLLTLRIYLEVGEMSEAVPLANSLYESAPQHDEVRRLWAETCVRTGRSAEAKEVLENLLEEAQGPERARLLRSLAKIDADADNFDEAITKMQQAQIFGGGADAVIELCQLYYAAGRKNDAEGCLLDMASQPATEPGMILSGAVLAYNHGNEPLVRKLGDTARQRVLGTPAEDQVLSILRSMGVELDAPAEG